MQIYIHKNNQQLGPFTEAQIKAQLSAGTLSLQDPAWWDGQASWVPLGQSPLAASLAPGVPALPAPVPGISPVMPPPGEATSGLAITSLVLGIVGLACYPTAILVFLPTLICGHMALSQTSRALALKGRGMAIAGLILGYLQLFLIIVIFAISVLIALGKQVKSMDSTQLNSVRHDSDNSTNSVNP